MKKSALLTCFMVIIIVFVVIFSTIQVTSVDQPRKKAARQLTFRPPDDLTKKLPNSNWVLIWSDEFNQTSLASEKWNVVEEAPFKNKELQYYVRENIVISEGCLNIKSARNPVPPRKYTSGAIQTKGKFAFRYGRIEIRAKLPKGKGIFPAFWLLPDSEQYLPEIDIMELIGQEPTQIWVVYHWLSDTGKKLRKYALHNGPDYAQGFHRFALEWEENQLSWFIDDVKIFSVDKSPTQPMYLVINTAIGGDWPGNPNLATKFPQFLTVDYVRVYQHSSP